MSQHIFQHYVFDTNLSSEPQLNCQDNSENMLRQLQNQLQALQNNNIFNIPNISPIINQNYLPTNPWIPSQKFLTLLNTFKTSILNQFICVLYTFCGRLMYPKKCKWSAYTESDHNNYPLLQAYPEEQLIFHTSLPKRIAVCLSYKEPLTRYPFPFLCPIPNEIEAVPLNKRMYLSPVFMHCSLGRTSADSAIYSEYKILTDSPVSNTANPFPRAFHIPNDDSAPPFLNGDIVVPNNNFNIEIHNEDFHYTHLMAGFLKSPDNTLLPLSVDDPDLEPLLFPDLFPDGKGHYHNIISNNNNTVREETYSKYIKQRVLNIDSRFRLNHRWLAWSYLQLEKIRNHQNNQRLWRQKQTDKIYRPPSAAELIQRSLYTNKPIINESITTTLPTFIRTGDTYFHEKELHVNTMISEYGLPSLFITLTMAESHWTHLHKILKATDNHNTIPTNRPLHTTLHFIHRFQELKKNIWKNPEHSEWNELKYFFERIEFQNRGAAHTHGVYWVSKSIEQMIAENIIRSDLPDPITESELYAKVKANQIHTCSIKCGGQPAPGHTCKKGFPQPFSPYTYYDNDTHRYIYKCIKPEDHSRGLARYLSKYISKSEPCHIFNVKEGDKFREHIIARRLGSMELLFLILGETICNSSCTVSYLTTDPPTSRQKAIRPVYLINEEEDDPYWKDHIEKYFNRPFEEEFNNLTYPDYYKYYDISKSLPSTKRQIHNDLLNNYVVKRTTPKLVRFRYLKLQDGELYFYQKLLLELPCRNEEELLGTFQTYREHWLFLHPELYEKIQQITQEYLHTQQLKLDAQFSQIVVMLLNELQNFIPSSVLELINIQLSSLRINPQILPQCSTLDLPNDLISTIKNILGPKTQKNKYPYFFITGPAGTGKSFIINLITKDLINKRSKYLLLAPTAQLPPVTGLKIYKSSEWKLFYPLFLTKPQRQNQDQEFYNVLQEIRFGKISPRSWDFLYQKAAIFNQQQPLHIALNTTNIVGYKEAANRINNTICNMLPVNENKFLISEAVDIINGEQYNPNESQKLFKKKLEVRVVFSIIGGIVDIVIKKDTATFFIDGKPSSRCQFPLQNSFALTVHKTQGLTLPEVSLSLDNQIFAEGQAYVAISRCSNWSKVHIASLNPGAFITDQLMIKEYERLEKMASTPLPL
ncbi:Pif1-like helicase domain-containing protein [Rhizophagus clarus]|uniref:Pif1-like helicase domain-containing protein n=1 Tax=Rhizophagus clarus TaxID=94130 RepID=A0A8H3KSJ3_9GLOM|nr:Pif1-like helicase domain-containing protein [Rhizophagus clarus]